MQWTWKDLHQSHVNFFSSSHKNFSFFFILQLTGCFWKAWFSLTRIQYIWPKLRDSFLLKNTVFMVMGLKGFSGFACRDLRNKNKWRSYINAFCGITDTSSQWFQLCPFTYSSASYKALHLQKDCHCATWLCMHKMCGNHCVSRELVNTFSLVWFLQLGARFSFGMDYKCCWLYLFLHHYVSYFLSTSWYNTGQSCP